MDEVWVILKRLRAAIKAYEAKHGPIKWRLRTDADGSLEKLELGYRGRLYRWAGPSGNSLSFRPEPKGHCVKDNCDPGEFWRS